MYAILSPIQCFNNAICIHTSVNAIVSVMIKSRRNTDVPVSSAATRSYRGMSPLAERSRKVAMYAILGPNRCSNNAICIHANVNAIVSVMIKSRRNTDVPVSSAATRSYRGMTPLAQRSREVTMYAILSPNRCSNNASCIHTSVNAIVSVMIKSRRNTDVPVSSAATRSYRGMSPLAERSRKVAMYAILGPNRCSNNAICIHANVNAIVSVMIKSRRNTDVPVSSAATRSYMGDDPASPAV